MTDFFAMGGYAAYVWPAYGAALVLQWVARARNVEARVTTSCLRSTVNRRAAEYRRGYSRLTRRFA